MQNADSQQIVADLAVKKPRNSNLELLRIFAMLAIIAHHYVVNSTVMDHFTYDNPSTQQYFLLIWGRWGKTAINSFILISGYFLCKMTLTWQRWFKLLFQIYFYGILIMLLFAIFGYEPLTIKIVIKRFIGIFKYINNGFGSSFMVFYAFVPYYNKLISNISKQQLTWLVLGLIFVFTICSTFLNAKTMNEPFWYMTLYFVAAYVNLYPSKFFSSLKIWSWILVIGVLLAIASVVGLFEIFKAHILDRPIWTTYHFVSDSNKILAFIVGFSAFMVAKNLPPFYNRFINIVSAGTFGVLLIHASSNTMRRWLWQDICNVPGMLYSNFSTLFLQALLVPLVVFSVCSFIDYFYRKWIEKPLMLKLNSQSKFVIQINKFLS